MLHNDSCTTEGCVGKFHLLNTVDIFPQILAHYHCPVCHYTYTIEFSHPHLHNKEYDAPRLVAMHGDDRHQYWKCIKPGSDTYTLVAKTRFCLKKDLEAMGFTVEISVHELPAYRLYELK